MTAASLNAIKGAVVQRDGVDYEVVDFQQRHGVNMVGLKGVNGGALRYVTAAIFAADFWSA